MAALSRIAALAGPIGLAVAGVTALGFAARRAADALERQARLLAQYSASLAAVTAQTDIMRQQAQIERAREIGDELARFETDRARVERVFTDLGTQILKVLLDIYNAFGPFIEAQLRQLELTAKGIEIVGDLPGVLNFGAMLLNPAELKKYWDELLRDLEDVKRIIRGDDTGKDQLIDEFTAQFLRQFNSDPAILGMINRGRAANNLPPLQNLPF